MFINFGFPLVQSYIGLRTTTRNDVSFSKKKTKIPETTVHNGVPLHVQQFIMVSLYMFTVVGIKISNWRILVGCRQPYSEFMSRFFWHFQKIKDAIQTHNTDRCSIGPNKGVGELKLDTVLPPKNKHAEST
ncbi:thioredoxin-like 2, chloroplastic [Artemisia annua]|uniref:Thioredoxin-like 2, chloroplastic n=1 Tax=Artemisia annua TaxID=35608 RepID=A0A2U1M0G7_ARTAN|nr:thioredoxin-like 2, chloroplastic [Artemisia annua]